MSHDPEIKITDLIQHMTALSIETGDMEQLLELLSNFTHVAAAFIDSEKKLTVTGNSPEVFKENVRLYPFEEIQRIYYSYTITSASDHIGSLILDIPFGSDLPSKDLLPHFANSAKICRMNEINDTFFSESDDSMLFSLLKGTIEDMGYAKTWLKKKRINTEGKFRAVSIWLKGNQDQGISEEEIFAERKLLCQRYYGISRCSSLPFLYLMDHEMIFFLFSVNENSSLKPIIINFSEISSHHLSEHHKCKLIPLIGCGDEGAGYEEIASSWKNSISAIRHTIICSKQHLSSEWTDMGAEKICASLANNAEHLVQCKKILYPLLTYDNSHHGSLFRTMVVFVLNHWNLTLSAKKMFLHYNSIKYRYNNISEILGMDLDDPQNRFDLSLLVKIYLYSLDVKELDLLISGCL